MDIQYASGIPQKFAFHLMGYIDGQWVDLVRIDNAHDPDDPHRHVFHPDRPEDTWHFVAALPESVVGWAQDHLKEQAEHYYEEYTRDLHNMQGASQ